MSGRVIDTAALQCLGRFEQITNVPAKDCIIQENAVLFFVDSVNAGKAIGHHGDNVHRIEKELARRVKVIAFDNDPCTFTKNIVAPLELAAAEENEGIITLTAKDLKTRGMLIGRNGTNLRLFESIVQRFFPIKEIRIR